MECGVTLSLVQLPSVAATDPLISDVLSVIPCDVRNHTFGLLLPLRLQINCLLLIVSNPALLVLFII